MPSFKLPPDPSSSNSYVLWRKDALIWQKLTGVAKAKQGLALQYACRGNARIHEAVTNIDDARVECDDGFKNVLAVLDALFKLDEKDEEMKAYQEFETARREDGQTIADFINQFDELYKKTKDHGNVMTENLLALKLMRAANLTNTQQLIIKASTVDINYTTVKQTMKRTFGESTGFSDNINTSGSDGRIIKSEQTLQSSHSCGACNCNDDKDDQNKGSHQSGEFQDNLGEKVLYGKYGKNKYDSWQSNGNRNSQMTEGVTSRNPPKKGKNPLDKRGNITRCNICESINHCANQSPD